MSESLIWLISLDLVLIRVNRPLVYLGGYGLEGKVFLFRYKSFGLVPCLSFSYIGQICRNLRFHRRISYVINRFRSKIAAQCSSNTQVYLEEIPSKGCAHSVAPSVGIIALYLMNTESNVKSPCYLPAEVSLKQLQNKSRIILSSLENSQFIKLLLGSFCCC